MMQSDPTIVKAHNGRPTHQSDNECASVYGSRNPSCRMKALVQNIGDQYCEDG